MNRTFLLLLMFVAVGFGIKADDMPKQLVRQIHGIVSDSKGEPLTGAAVSLKKKGTVATTTDADGLFVLDGVPEKGTLQVSYFGYVPVEIRLKPGKDDYAVVMEEALLSMKWWW